MRLNLPVFISKRISKNEQGSFSTTINKIAVVSIAVALTSLILAFMILKGYEKAIKEKIFSFSGHLIITKYTLSSSYEDSFIETPDSVIQSLSQIEGVKSLHPFAFKAGLLKNKEEVQGIIMKGIDASFDSMAFADQLVAGRYLSFPKDGYGSEVMLSKKIANYLSLKVGEEVIILFLQNPPRTRKLKVVGLFETGLEDFDDRTIIGDINLVRRINGWTAGQSGGLEVYLDDPERLEEAEDQLFEVTDANLYVDKVTDRYPQIFDWLIMLDRNVQILLVIIMVVACFNMISILLILIMERTQMIGTLKALGAPDGLLRRIFFSSGIRLILNGLLWGNLLGVGICWLQYQFKLVPLDPVNYYVSYVPVAFDLKIILLLNVMAVLLIGLTLLIPLAVISRINPIRAIRFD